MVDGLSEKKKQTLDGFGAVTCCQLSRTRGQHPTAATPGAHCGSWQRWSALGSGGFVPAPEVVVAAARDAVTVAGVPSCIDEVAGVYLRAVDVALSPFQDGRPVYQRGSGLFLYYWDEHKDWRIGDDYRQATALFASKQGEATISPGTCTAWYYWGGSDCPKWSECSSVCIREA